MSILAKLWNRTPKVENPWDINLSFKDKQYSDRKPPNVYLGSHLEIRASGDNEITIARRSAFVGPMLYGIAWRSAISPNYTTKPEPLHNAPLSKPAALALLDHHFSDRDFASDEQRAAFHNWKSKLPETDMQGYKLTPRPAPANAPAPSAT